MAFTGIPSEGFKFLLDIRFNNNREWFNANKDIYIKCLKEPLYALAAELAPAAQAVDPVIDGRPARIVARIYRDARRCKGEFYRDVLWLSFKRVGETNSTAISFYFYLNPESVGWGMGFYEPQAEVMQRFRDRIDARHELFRRIIANPALKAYEIAGDSYARPKKPGMDADLAFWYNKKTFYTEYAEPVSPAAFSPDLAARVRQCIIDHGPLYRFVTSMEVE
jgi:uncharacterized protein (TIGR02453 family)